MDKESLKCYVHKFSQKINLSDIDCVYPCLKYRLLAINSNEKSITFLKIDTRLAFEKTLHAVTYFLWSNSSSGQRVSEYEGQACFCTLSEDGIVSTNCINQTTVTTLVEQHVRNIVGLQDKGLSIEKPDDITLVAYDGVTIIVCIKQQHLAVLEVKKDNFVIVSVVDLPANQSDNGLCYRVINDIIVVFNLATTTLSLYDISSGNLIVQLDFKNTNVDSDRVMTWTVSPDLKSLYVLENTLAASWIDLENYVQKYPSCVQRKLSRNRNADFSQSAVLQTCHIGDSVWRENLFSLNDSHCKQIKPPWYQRWKGSLSDKGQSSKSKVSGFRQKHLKSSGVNSDIELKIYLPASLQGMKIRDMTVGERTFSVVFMSDKETVLSICDFSTKLCTIERFPTNSFVMLSRDSSFPHIVVMETHLLCIVTDLSLQQEEFVSKVMLYAGASIADAVCHINKWGRCSIPIHTLEVGLKHRQLDTVSFFLKSKENFFTTASTLAVTSPSSPSIPSPTWSFTSNHLDNLGQLEPALYLLLQTIKENMSDSQSKHFARKLADVTLDFLYRLLHDGLGLSESLKDKYGHENEVSDLKQALEKLLDMIADLRKCIRSLQEKLTKQIQKDELDGDRKSWTDTKERDHLNTEQLIESGVMRNNIPILQTQLQERGAVELATIQNITRSSFNRVIQYLLDKDSKPAIIILANLGFNVDNKLWEIAELSDNDEMRDFIVSVLKSRSSLQQHHQEIIKCSSLIRDSYPSPSFTTTLSDMSAETDGEKEILDFLPVESKCKFDLVQECGDITRLSQTSTNEPGLYAEVLWDWLRYWDSYTKERVVLEAKMKTGDILDFYKTVDSTLLLNYLLQHNKVQGLVVWIKKLIETKDIPTLYLILNNLQPSTAYCRDVIVDLCARHGIIKDTSDFTELLRYLRFVGGPLRLPHPVNRLNTGNTEIFHGDFIKYCARNNLPTVLWHYCHQHQLQTELLQRLSYDVQHCKWMAMFVMFYCITKDPHDSSLMYEASLASAGMVWSLDEPSVSQLLRKGETLTALATLMYSPQDLHQVVPGVSRLQAIDDMSIDDVEKILLPFPKLHSALFPASTIDAPKNDVTVYDLLKDNAPFDPARLFGWQKMNKLAGEDCQRHLPHFSSQELVSKFGVVEKIKYTYYLKQGRPSFAFASFLAEELDSDPTSMPSARLLQASSTALWIGVRNFHVSQVSCACVVFTEMLGQDSIVLRTYLQVGQEILVHLNQGLTGSFDQKKESAKKLEDQIVNWLCGCILHRKKYATFVLQKLEDAISASIKHDRISETSFDASQKWMIAILFCRLLQLPMTTKFLETCAQSDKWLPFLWFSQIHQYTKEQLQTILYHFKSQHLQQHLHYVIENAETKAVIDDETIRKRSNSKVKDSRTALYSKIGLNKEEGSVDVSSSEDEANIQLNQTLAQQMGDAENEDVCMTVDIQSVPDDIFGVVFMAQKSKCPWKSLLHLSVVLCNPLLAELAACFKESLILPCLCGWLVAMMNSVEHDRVLRDYGKNIAKWTTKHLGNILDIYLNNSWGSTLATSFHIFQPTSPLLHFLKFSAEITERRNYSECKTVLEDFKESMHQFCHGDKNGKQEIVIGDSDWLQQTIYRILHHHFTHMTSLYDILQLLKLLDFESIVLIFNFDVPDFGKLSRMVQYMVDASITDVNFSAFVTSDKSVYQSECEKVINLMLEQGSFRQARKFAQEAGLSVDGVTMKEVYHEKHKLESSAVWKSSVARKKFWNYCANEFKCHQLSSSLINKFFMDEVDVVDNDEEKAYLYELCIHTLEQIDCTDALDNLYHQMWVYKIKDKLHKIQVQQKSEVIQEDDMFAVEERTTKSVHSGRKELLCFGKMPKTGDMPKDLSEKEIQALGFLVEELLDQGQITESCHLAAEFSYYSQDLAIILTCIRMSLGSVTINNMDPAMFNLLTSDSSRFKRPSLTSVGSSMNIHKSTSTLSIASVASSSMDFLPVDKEKIVVTMDTLYSHCHHGNQCCKQIINCYLIACVLDMTYEDVVGSEEFEILRALLKTEFYQRFKLASEYLSSSSLTSAQVAGFLSDSIVEAYNVTFGQDDSKDTESLLFNPAYSMDVTEHFVKLCQDPSLLGDRLLDAVASLSGNSREIPKSVLATQTELLILAHLCHTAACNMEGISNVLRAARVLTYCIEYTQEFSLMVRLLIGVGRFNEMTYIFDSLKQNEQFELLLKKGIEKENSLKIAVLDYLKRFHASDRDSYDMVAHYFMMHREIAEMLEKRADQALAVYKKKPLDNSPETQSSLETVVQYLTDAAESYIKERCLRHAQVCARQARLVALQVHYLSTGLKVIHLTLEEAENIVSTHPKFMEALIISETYGRKGCWPTALCNNVIMNGDFRYLQDFKSHIRLTPNLIADAVEIYQLNPNKSSQSINNIKKFLTYCKDIRIHYKIAQNLDLRDVMTSLEKGDTGSYIQDIISTMS